MNTRLRDDAHNKRFMARFILPCPTCVSYVQQFSEGLDLLVLEFGAGLEARSIQLGLSGHEQLPVFEQHQSLLGLSLVGNDSFWHGDEDRDNLC